MQEPDYSRLLYHINNELKLFFTPCSSNLEIAAEMGYRDYNEGYLYNENPYPERSRLFISWEEGWEEAFCDRYAEI
jgi:hypothetical protein